MDHFPANNAAHFQITLPDTLHFPNHEVCLERIYYSKELSSTPDVKIRLAIEQNEATTFARYFIPHGVKSGKEFAHHFIANLTYLAEATQSVVFNAATIDDDDASNTGTAFKLFDTRNKVDESRDSNLIAISNVLNEAVDIEFPRVFLERYKIVSFAVPSDAHPKEIREKLRIPSKTSIWIESRITGGEGGGPPVATSFRGDVKKRAAAPATVETTLNAGYYATGSTFVTAVNDAIWTTFLQHHAAPRRRAEGPFTFREVRNRCFYEPISPYLSVDLKNVARILGYHGEDEIFSNVSREASHRIDTTDGAESIYVYSSIVDSVIVGNVKVPLLSVLPLNRRVQGVREYYEFVNPPYQPLVRHPFKTVEVQLCDDMGEVLSSVLIGKTILGVHIRDVKSQL